MNLPPSRAAVITSDQDAQAFLAKAPAVELIIALTPGTAALLETSSIPILPWEKLTSWRFHQKNVARMRKCRRWLENLPPQVPSPSPAGRVILSDLCIATSSISSRLWESLGQ